MLAVYLYRSVHSCDCEPFEKSRRPVLCCFLKCCHTVTIALMFVCSSQWQNQGTSPIKSISILPNQVPTSSPRPSDGKDFSWVLKSPFSYSSLVPHYLMWQPILRGHWLQWPPQGERSTYLCGSRQLSLPIICGRPRGQSIRENSSPQRRSELPALSPFASHSHVYSL